MWRRKPRWYPASLLLSLCCFSADAEDQDEDHDEGQDEDQDEDQDKDQSEDQGEDQSEDQSEDQDDKPRIKTKIKTTRPRSRRRSRQRSRRRRSILTLSSSQKPRWVILDLNLRRALLLYEGAAATAGQRAKHRCMREWLKCEDPKLTQKGAR